MGVVFKRQQWLLVIGNISVLFNITGSTQRTTYVSFRNIDPETETGLNIATPANAALAFIIFLLSITGNF